MSSLAASLRTQGTVVWALFLRDMNSRYANSRVGYTLAFVDPVLGILIVAAIRYYIRGATSRHGMPILLFAITGYLVWYAFRVCATEVAAVTSKTGTQAMLMFPQVTMLDLILSRFTLAWFTYMGVLATMTAFVLVFTTLKPPVDGALLVFSIFGGLWLGGAVGIIQGISMRYIPALSWVYMGLYRLGPFVSGALFMADEMPMWIQPYLSWNPVFHLCELNRMGWLASYTSPFANVWYPTLCAFIASAIGLVAERAIRAYKAP